MPRYRGMDAASATALIQYENSHVLRVSLSGAGMRGTKEGVDLRERTVVHVAAADAQTRAADGHRTPPLFATRSHVERADAQDAKIRQHQREKSPPIELIRLVLVLRRYWPRWRTPSGLRARTPSVPLGADWKY